MQSSRYLLAPKVSGREYTLRVVTSLFIVSVETNTKKSSSAKVVYLLRYLATAKTNPIVPHRLCFSPRQGLLLFTVVLQEVDTPDFYLHNIMYIWFNNLF